MNIPRMLSVSLLLVLAGGSLARAQGARPADLVITNADIHTMDDARPTAEMARRPDVRRDDGESTP